MIIAYEKLAALTGHDDYDSFRQSHKEWVDASLADGNTVALLVCVLFVYFPGVVGIEGGHCCRSRGRVLTQVFFIDHAFLVKDKGHNA